MVRRAQLSIQFHWLFILIVGAIVLVFFFTIIHHQQQASDAERASDLIVSLDAVFSSAQHAENAVQTFFIPGLDIELMCEDNQSRYFIEGASPVPTTFDPIFSSTHLSGRSLRSWSLTWSAPYPVIPLLFLTDDRTIFLFVSDNHRGIVAHLYHSFPQNWSALFLSRDEFSASEDSFSSLYRRKVIITDINDLSTSLRDASFRFVGDFSSSAPSQVLFKDAGSSSQEYVWVYGEPLLWGAIFSENPEFYRCNVQKVLSRLKTLSSLLELRTRSLSNDMVLTSCYDYLLSADNSLQVLSQGVSLSDQESAFQTIAEQVYLLSSLQKRIERGTLCPYIY